MKDFTAADRISDKIVDLINEQCKLPDVTAVQAFAGQLLAIMALTRTAPPTAPPEFKAVVQAAERCLQSMIAAAERGMKL